MSAYAQKERILISVIGDEDSVTGLLLAGIGHIDSKNKPNFLIVDNSMTSNHSYPSSHHLLTLFWPILLETPIAKIEETFTEYTRRKDIAIILINQHVRMTFRHAANSLAWSPFKDTRVLIFTPL